MHCRGPLRQRRTQRWTVATAAPGAAPLLGYLNPSSPPSRGALRYTDALMPLLRVRR